MARVLDPEGAHLAALRRLQDFTRARVVEVGCGDGRLTPGIAERADSVLAFDPDEAAVARARAALPDALVGCVTYRVGSAIDLEVGQASFDIAVFSWTL
jgi:ubiquinone/menaquinone biosynthesis C-methylase UbiE